MRLLLPKRRLGNFKGFTLFEVLLTISLLSIIIGIGSCYIFVVRVALVKIELERLHTSFVYVNRLAILQSRILELKFDSKNHTYSYPDIHNNIKINQMSKDVVFGTLPGLKGPPSAPVNIIINPISFKNNNVIFYPDGKISSGTVYITDNKLSCMYAISIPVSDFPYIRKYYYKDKWMLLK